MTSGPTKPHAERLSDGRRRVLVQVYLSELAGEALDRLVRLRGSKRAAIETSLIYFDAVERLGAPALGPGRKRRTAK